MPESYTMDYMAVFIAGLVGLGGMLIAFGLNYLMAPKRPSEAKITTYECGIPALPFPWSQVHVRYYIFAILFLIFDVEAVFLFPWAVIFLGIGDFYTANIATGVFYEMLLFVGILFFGIIYGWKKGVLQWR